MTSAPGPLRLVLRIAFHTALLGVMPFAVGGFTALFAEVSQVGRTAGALARIVGAGMLPVLLAQLVSIAVKVRRERAARRADPCPGARPSLLAVVDRHVRVLTPKGVWMLAGALASVSAALAFKFAELGILAVLGLVTVVGTATAGLLLSTFVVVRFEHRLAARGGTVGREFSPALVESGDSVEERFHLERVPVPPGFRLRIHQALPARLESESRHVVGPEASRSRLTLARPLRRTPRGDYTLGPADVAYTDLLGLTHVAVAQAASARLKVLPRLHPVVLEDSPRALARDEGPLSVLRRLPTDDYFRFRDYVPGDDTRRIHWKLSVRVGKLQVRLPETVPVVRRRVRLVLDTFLDPAVRPVPGVFDDLMDRLVELWLSLARALAERGEEVTLALPTGDRAHPVEELRCRRGTQARWRDLGARAAWQGTHDLDRLEPAGPREAFLVAVTARFTPPPALAAGRGLSWVHLPAEEHLPGPVPGLDLESPLLLPFPPGAAENHLLPSLRRLRGRRRTEAERRRLVALAEHGGAQCEAVLRARGEPFHKALRAGAAYVLHP